MSVKINGMEMPLSCLHCSFHCWEDSNSCYCLANHYSNITDVIKQMSKPDDCPLQEVKE